jgi:hypothetical protein
MEVTFSLKEGFLFKNHQQYIPRGSMRENMIRELHNGGLSGHFGVDETKAFVEECYYWLGMAKDVKKWVEHYIICQHAKDQSQKYMVVHTIGCQEIGGTLHNLSICKRPKSKYRVVHTIANTKSAMGGH